jgi:peptide-methionine (R)-S-oxide reductase
MKKAMPKSDDEWKERLDGSAYNVLRGHGTELPFTGKLLFNKEHGAYVCAGCGADLFRSKDKFESGTGWPSFDKAIPGAVETTVDETFGMRRAEVHCAKCKGHLGHIFDDGPTQTGKRFCINICALGFEKKPQAKPKSKARGRKK